MKRRTDDPKLLEPEPTLKERRLRIGYTQKQAADMLCKPLRTYQHWERENIMVSAISVLQFEFRPTAPPCPTPEDLSALIEASGLSVCVFASIIGVTPATVYRWLKGGKIGPRHRQSLEEAKELLTQTERTDK
jgi:transcriptional regulator with XRE-family HTH domain